MDVLLKRGTNNALSIYVGTVGELTVGTDDYSVRLMTGETKGGIKLAREDRTISYRSTTMYDLGFNKTTKYDLTEFFKMLYEREFQSKSIINFIYYFDKRATITDGTNECTISGGTFILMALSNQKDYWSCSYGTYIPCNEGKIYNFLLYYGGNNGTTLSTKQIIPVG